MLTSTCGGAVIAPLSMKLLYLSSSTCSLAPAASIQSRCLSRRAAHAAASRVAAHLAEIPRAAVTSSSAASRARSRSAARAAVSAVAIAVAAVSSTRLCRHPRSRRAARRRASRAPTPEVSAKRREFVGRRDLRRRARDRTSHARATARRASLRATCELAAITAIAARGLGRGHALCRTQEEVTVIFMQARDPRAAAAAPR